MAKLLLEEVLHELNILHGLWVTDKLAASSFQIDTVPLIKKVEMALSKKPIVDELVEALEAIRGETQKQLQYLKARGLNPPKAKGGWIMTLEDCEWVGDYETDARHTYPNQWRLVSAIVQAALARYQKEVGDDEA